MFNQVPPGLMVFPGTTPERSDQVLFELLKKQGTLDGKKVAVLAQQTSEPSVKAVVLPAIKKLGVATGTTAYLTINGPDTTAAQSALDSFIERWKTEGVNALFVTGTQVASNQFIDKVRSEMPQVMLVTDVEQALDFAKDETKAGKKPNPYEGILTATG